MAKSAAQLQREIDEVLRRRPIRPSRGNKTRGHAIKKASEGGRWNHRSVATELDVPEDIVRRIYGAVQIAKKQGLYGGHFADLVERAVGRRLIGNEYDVSKRAKQHLDYNPPGGYSGPLPTGAARPPARASAGSSKFLEAAHMRGRGDTIIKNVLELQARYPSSWDEKAALARLRVAAEELDVAADLYEDAGASVNAGSLRERARLARSGDLKRLASYD